MKGDPMCQYIPLHLSCLQRQPSLAEWIQRFVRPSKGQREIELLGMEDWFTRGHDIQGGSHNLDGVWIPKFVSGTYVWTPPPAAAQIAIEQLRAARVKRERSTHVFIVPRLMSPEWLRQLYRVSDLCLELPFDKFWSKSAQHEPLIIGFVFPFLSHRPWQLKRSGAFLGMARAMRRVWRDSEGPTWPLLSKFFTSARSLESLPEGLVREMLQSPHSFGIPHSQGGE